jgi:hypothetical protein
MKTDFSRLGRLFYCLISVLVCAQLVRAQAPALTTINDTVYRADGTAAAGQLVITWPAFTTADNKPVAAGEKTLTLGANGVLNTQLAPNEGARPAGSYYKVVYKLSDGTTATEYWTVPSTTPTKVGAIRATVVPAQVAAQLVTRQYVDSVLTGPSSDLVHKSTAETISGAKTFTTAPLVPTPANAGEATNKSYVDVQTAAILHVQPDPGAANNFLTGITSAGVITKAQPAFANISGTLGVAQGGTGQTTYTKGDVLAAANSTTLNKLAVGSDGQVLTADSTQTNGVKWATVSTLLDYQKAGSAIVGDGTDKPVFTYTLPGSTLGAGKGVRIVTEMQHSTGTGSVNYKIFFGSTQLLSQASTSTVMAKLGAIIFNDPGSTTAQQGTATDLLFGSTMAALPTAPAVGTENTANPVLIKVTFNAASTEQVTPKVWLVEAIR